MSVSITGRILNSGSQPGCPLAAFASLLLRGNIVNNTRNLSRDIPTEAAYGVWIIDANSSNPTEKTSVTRSCVWLSRRIFFFLQWDCIPQCKHRFGWQTALLLLFVYLLLCISVCFLLYEFEHFWAEEYFKYIPGRAVLSYLEIFIYPWYTGECRFLNRLHLFFPS